MSCSIHHKQKICTHIWKFRLPDCLPRPCPDQQHFLSCTGTDKTEKTRITRKKRTTRFSLICQLVNYEKNFVNRFWGMSFCNSINSRSIHLIRKKSTKIAAPNRQRGGKHVRSKVCQITQSPQPTNQPNQTNQPYLTTCRSCLSCQI